jgi:hypothetical protein
MNNFSDLLTLDLVEELTCGSFVHEYEVGDSYQDLFSIWAEANCPDLISLVCFCRRHWYLFFPLNERAHF